MFHPEEWKAISSRIKGVLEAGELHARFLLVNSSDTYSRSRKLREHCESILETLEQYSRTHKERLPASAFKSIAEFISTNRQLFTDTSGTNDSIGQRVWAALVLLGGLESEVSFLLSGSEEAIRSRADRALAHLQRCIVADPTVRASWAKAFLEGEVACERLGGSHLLLHGIFAFKVNAEGERTDLVFQDILGDMSRPIAFSDGLVLTEWKKAKNARDVEVKFDEAQAQAIRYSSGALGGTELCSYRYLVVVSEDLYSQPKDLISDAITYRRVNIAIAPRSPSKAR